MLTKIVIMAAMVVSQVSERPCFWSWFTEAVSCGEAQRASASPTELARIAKEIRRADYEDDRPGLQRLSSNLEAFTGDSALGALAHYWRGYAMWRRAINGFNDGATKTELNADLVSAVHEFEQAEKSEVNFVESTIGEVSCEMNLIYVYRDDPEEARKHIVRTTELVKAVQEKAPNNPRFLWIYGANIWYRPATVGGSQEKAFETYRRGLELAKVESKKEKDGLAPNWGEPELLMSLAWSSLNGTTPDAAAAKRYAQAALKIVPKWHYMRDILTPQIDAFEAKQEAEKRSAKVEEKN